METREAKRIWENKIKITKLVPTSVNHGGGELKRISPPLRSLKGNW